MGSTWVIFLADRIRAVWRQAWPYALIAAICFIIWWLR